jgi:hypothetical protein
MNIKPLKNARLLQGKTPYGAYRIEVGNHSGPIFNASGEQIGTLTMEMRDPAPPRTEPCQHRGDVMTERECKTCAGKVMVKVFQCSIESHPLCTVKTKFDDLPGCDRCNDYKESKP